MHDSTDSVCLSVVRRQRAGRLVIPVAAQSHGDGGTRSLDVSVGSHEVFRLMSEYLAHGASVLSDSTNATGIAVQWVELMATQPVFRSEIR